MVRWQATHCANTLNVCLGHKPFPDKFRHHVDVMLSPRPLLSPFQTVVVDDNKFGQHGSSLSEYSQLIWLYDHFSKVINDYEYVRIFQYRRFVSPNDIGNVCSHPWAKWTKARDISRYDDAFRRACSGEMFNHPFGFPETVLGQYKNTHIEDDILNFARFLVESNKFSHSDESAFLNSVKLIPACNMGVFKTSTLLWLLAELKDASQFMNTKYFTPRPGYQRRVTGFLLERLNSYLLLSKYNGHRRYGFHTIIADGPNIETTTNISS